MFIRKKKQTVTVSNGSKELLKEQVLNLQVAQDELLFKLQSRNTYELDQVACPLIDFKHNASIQYVKGVFVQDLTTDEQTSLGISIFHVKVKEATSSPVHKHDSRYQIVYVKEGKIINNETDDEYLPGDTFCISKKENHSITYTAGSDIIFISIPGLSIINDVKRR